MGNKRLFLRKPVFSEEELMRLANIFDNAGQVFLGVMVVSPLVVGIDNTGLLMIFSGGVLTVGCWLLSLYFTRKAGKK